jgi:hypothetical protein
MIVKRPRLFYQTLAVLALAIVIGANAHLIHVATATQPRCVPHVKAGDPRSSAGDPAPLAGDPAPLAGSFSAAGSAC